VNISIVENMSQTIQQVFEEVLDDVLSSWTALDLAITHYDGHFREGQEKRMTLLGSLSDAIRSERFEAEEIAEFLFSFMDEDFNMELDDNSHVDVANTCMNAWSMIKEGVRPHLARRGPGQSVAVIEDQTEEVEGEVMEDDDSPPERSQFNNNPRIVTDEDGWSTVVPKNIH
jgi:hypothetical protein